jgi:hypothetical protein
MTSPIKDGKKSDHGASGRFTKGNKASPGRPPGRGVVAQLREKLALDIDQIINKLREQALAGDPQAMRIVLDRVLPSLRPVELPTPLDLPDGTLTAQGRAVLSAVAAGDLAPGQGAQLLAAIGSLTRLTEIDEMAARIEKLEATRDAENQT